jgi:chromosome segregation ATPase
MTVGVRVEEHPELDNPLDRARQDVIGLTVQLDEAKDAQAKAESGVALAKNEVEHREQVLEEAERDVAILESSLQDAQDALAKMEGA